MCVWSDKDGSTSFTLVHCWVSWGVWLIWTNSRSLCTTAAPNHTLWDDFNYIPRFEMKLDSFWYDAWLRCCYRSHKPTQWLAWERYLISFISWSQPPWRYGVNCLLNVNCSVEKWAFSPLLWFNWTDVAKQKLCDDLVSPDLCPD